MIRRIWAFALSLGLFAAILAGCGGTTAPGPDASTKSCVPGPVSRPAPPEVTAYPITLKDGAGRDVTIPAEPKRIISVAPSNSELLFALGKGSALVGRSEYDDYPAEVTEIESIGGFFPPNYEKIVSLQPDLMLLVGGSEDARNQLTDNYNLNVFVVDAQNFDELYATIFDLGTIVNAGPQAAKIVGEMQQKVEEVCNKVAKAPSKPKVFYETWNDPLMTAGAGTFVDDLIRLAGGENAATAVQGWNTFSMEQLVAADPDFYITDTADVASQVATRPGFASIKAVKESQVVAVEDPSLITRPGPRLVLGLEWFAHLLHPDLVK